MLMKMWGHVAQPPEGEVIHRIVSLGFLYVVLGEVGADSLFGQSEFPAVVQQYSYFKQSQVRFSVSIKILDGAHVVSRQS